MVSYAERYIVSCYDRSFYTTVLSHNTPQQSNDSTDRKLITKINIQNMLTEGTRQDGPMRGDITLHIKLI